MPTYSLNKETPETKAFDFRGDCCICAIGNGSIRILREMNGKFEIVTDQEGTPMEFGATGGVAFNGNISNNVRIPHKIQCTGDMLVTIRMEK